MLLLYINGDKYLISCDMILDSSMVQHEQTLKTRFSYKGKNIFTHILCYLMLIELTMTGILLNCNISIELFVGCVQLPYKLVITCRILLANIIYPDIHWYSRVVII